MNNNKTIIIILTSTIHVLLVVIALFHYYVFCKLLQTNFNFCYKSNNSYMIAPPPIGSLLECLYAFSTLLHPDKMFAKYISL